MDGWICLTRPLACLSIHLRYWPAVGRASPSRRHAAAQWRRGTCTAHTHIMHVHIMHVRTYACMHVTHVRMQTCMHMRRVRVKVTLLPVLAH